jgi:hypothetical protein
VGNQNPTIRKSITSRAEMPCNLRIENVKEEETLPQAR